MAKYDVMYYSAGTRKQLYFETVEAESKNLAIEKVCKNNETLLEIWDVHESKEGD